MDFGKVIHGFRARPVLVALSCRRSSSRTRSSTRRTRSRHGTSGSRTTASRTRSRKAAGGAGTSSRSPPRTRRGADEFETEWTQDRQERASTASGRVELWRRAATSAVPTTVACSSTGPTPSENASCSSARSRRSKPLSSSPRSRRPSTATTGSRTTCARRTTDAETDLSASRCKMATGSGKTVVMAMLIAWQTLNKRAQPAGQPVHRRLPRRRARHHHPRPAPRPAARPTRTTTTGNSTSSRPSTAADLGTAQDRHHQLPRLQARARRATPAS